MSGGRGASQVSFGPFAAPCYLEVYLNRRTMKMKLKMILTAAALVVSPALAFADCSYHTKQVMTCAAGSVYDAETSSCVVMSG